MNTTATPLAGPLNRESFLEAQRRNRHATWRLSFASAFAAVVMGIPLALTITPILYGLVLILADILSIWMPLPASFWQNASDIARYGMVALGWLTQGKAAHPQSLAIGTAVLLLPGAIVSAALCLGVNALFRRAGVGGALLALKAREPNGSDLKELQLSDVVQEMAIAGGLPAPRIMLIDARAPNAAAIGTSPRDARIVVSRGLLDQLSRDELEGALAHVVASVGNGDLRIAFRVTSVLETCGLLVALMNSPFGKESRRTLWRMVRYGFNRKNESDANLAEAAAVADILTRGAGLETDDIDNLFGKSSSKKSMLRSMLSFLLLPVFFTNLAVKLSLWFFSFALLGPCVSLLWRTRIYLADASAVQLTRNPDGLAQALRKLNSLRGPIPGGQWASHLFLVSPAGSDRANDDTVQTPQQEMLMRAWAASQTGGAGTLPSAISSGTPFFHKEFAAVSRAAIAGDQNAAARVARFRQAAASAFGIPVEEIPDLADVAAAQRGDATAARHLMEFARKYGGAEEQRDSNSSSSTSDSSSVFLSPHPSLKRRLRRLDRMGAHLALGSEDRKSWIILAVLLLILAPFALAAVALLLLLIAVMTMASLVFLTIWLALIHQVFVMFGHH